MSYEQLIDLYCQHLQGLRRAASTCKNFTQTARDFASSCRQQGAVSPEQVRLPHLTFWLASMKSRNYSVMTAYSRQRLVRTWFAWLALRGHVLLDPLKKFQPPRHPQILGRGAPSEAQVRAMLEAPPRDTPLGQRDRALLEFLYGTGLRAGECVRVELEHLNLNGGCLRVEHGKGGYQREVPLGPNLQTVMQHYLAEVRPRLKPRCARLWLNYHGHPPSVHMLEQVVRKWRQVCGLKDVTAHSFRHAYATHLLHGGAPLVALQRLLGHQTLQMTARYTHLVPADLQEELLRTHPRGKRKARGRGPKTER